MTSPIYDLVIIGAGPAGLTAGLYAVRKRLAERFPNVLFEAGLSRGVSYDLGKLCVFPQVSFADMAMPE